MNDFYNNEYPPLLKHITIYTIKVREVTPFKIYFEKDDLKLHDKKL